MMYKVQFTVDLTTGNQCTFCTPGFTLMEDAALYGFRCARSEDFPRSVGDDPPYFTLDCSCLVIRTPDPAMVEYVSARTLPMTDEETQNYHAIRQHLS